MYLDRESNVSYDANFQLSSTNMFFIIDARFQIDGSNTNAMSVLIVWTADKTKPNNPSGESRIEKTSGWIIQLIGPTNGIATTAAVKKNSRYINIKILTRNTNAYVDDILYHLFQPMISIKLIQSSKASWKLLEYTTKPSSNCWVQLY